MVGVVLAVAAVIVVGVELRRRRERRLAQLVGRISRELRRADDWDRRN